MYFVSLPKMKNRVLVIAGLSMALAVVFGALGAHYLKAKVDEGLLLPSNVESFQTGVKYQVYHSLALILLYLLWKQHPIKGLRLVQQLFITGIVLFSGSIYLLSTKALIGLDNISWLGPVTPLGGIAFILAWILFAYHFLKAKTNE